MKKNVILVQAGVFLLMVFVGCSLGEIGYDLDYEDQAVSNCFLTAKTLNSLIQQASDQGKSDSEIASSYWKGLYWKKEFPAWWISCDRIDPYPPDYVLDHGFCFQGVRLADLESTLFSQGEFFVLYLAQPFFEKGSYEFRLSGALHEILIRDQNQWKKLKCNHKDIGLVSFSVNPENGDRRLDSIHCGYSFESPGIYDVQIRYQGLIQDIDIDLKWKYLGLKGDDPCKDPVATRHWKGEYWDISDLDQMVPPALSTLTQKPNLVKSHGLVHPLQPDFDSLSDDFAKCNVKMDRFAARYTRKDVFFANSKYLFQVSGDDGFRLLLKPSNGNYKTVEICKDWSISPKKTWNCYANFIEAGSYDVILEYFENTQEQNLSLSWRDTYCYEASDFTEQKCHDLCDQYHGCGFEGNSGTCVQQGTTWCDGGSDNHCDPTGDKFFSAKTVEDILLR